jgi:hypothetical protein
MAGLSYGMSTTCWTPLNSTRLSRFAGVKPELHDEIFERFRQGHGGLLRAVKDEPRSELTQRSLVRLWRAQSPYVSQL